MENTNKNIVVIGVGNLGMRHLQSLTELGGYKLYGVENNKSRIQKLQEIFVEAVTIYQRIDMLPQDICLAVVATNSNVRRQVFEKLVAHSNVDNIIFEKVLFQNVEDYRAVGDILQHKHINAWVNCPRREWKEYQLLKEHLAGKKITVKVSGGEWGMGCNGIHMIDLFSFLAGTTEVNIKELQIERELKESKRKGFYEVYGGICGTSSKGDVFFMECRRDSQLPIEINIDTDSDRITIIESKQKMIIRSDSNEWEAEEKEFPIVFQSQLTSQEAGEVLETNDCKLPTYYESSDLHLKFINLLNNVFRSNGFMEGFCPIT